jgi:hypothetical protein
LTSPMGPADQAAVEASNDDLADRSVCDYHRTKVRPIPNSQMTYRDVGGSSP